MDAELLIKKLPLVDENILAEAANAPLLFVEAARYRVDCMRKVARAEAELDAGEADRAVELRHQWLEKGEKITVDEVKTRVKRNPKIVLLRGKRDDALADEELSKLILEAYRRRSDGIKIIAEAGRAEGMKEIGIEHHRVQHERIVKNARELENKRRGKELVE